MVSLLNSSRERRWKAQPHQEAEAQQGSARLFGLDPRKDVSETFDPASTADTIQSVTKAVSKRIANDGLIAKP